MEIFLYAALWIVLGALFTRKFLNPKASRIAKGTVILVWPLILGVSGVLIAIVLLVHFLGWLA